MIKAAVAYLLVSAVLASGAEPAVRAKPPQSVRIYVFDCGTLEHMDPTRFQLKKEEVGTDRISAPCFLIAHPKGTLMWDTGAVPDTAWKPTGAPALQHIVLPDGQQRDLTIVKPLNAELAEIGYTPAGVTYLGLSHYHWDHTANANEFAGATWLARQAERDAMFADRPPALTQPSGYTALRNSKTIILKTDEYDVFGDGSVIMKAAPGHTPGHQILYVKLAKTGPVVLSGDLYHYSQERTLNRAPTFEFNQEQTRATRVVIEEFLKQKHAQLWIQHDFPSNSKLRRAPAYYE